MEDDLFPGRKTIKARAFCLGERIDLRALETGRRMALAPLVVAVGDHGCAVLFRYGAVVLFGLDPLEEANFVAQINPLIEEPYSAPPDRRPGDHVGPGAGRGIRERRVCT